MRRLLLAARQNSAGVRAEAPREPHEVGDGVDVIDEVGRVDDARRRERGKACGAARAVDGDEDVSRSERDGVGGPVSCGGKGEPVSGDGAGE